MPDYEDECTSDHALTSKGDNKQFPKQWTKELERYDYNPTSNYRESSLVNYLQSSEFYEPLEGGDATRNLPKGNRAAHELQFPTILDYNEYNEGQQNSIYCSKFLLELLHEEFAK